jgi:hypothetical protein
MFPHAARAFLIERHVRNLDGSPRSAIAVLGITSLTPGRAEPERIAVHVRRHWGIENKLDASGLRWASRDYANVLSLLKLIT